MRALQLLETAKLQFDLLQWYFGALESRIDRIELIVVVLFLSDSIDEAFVLVHEDVLRMLHQWEVSPYASVRG